jgi:hypothetical protein
MNFRFYVDPATDLPHINSHSVDEEEVEEAFFSRGEDRQGQEGGRVAIGRTSAGRYLRIIYSRDLEPDSVFVITAYELRGKPLAAYLRRRRRRQQ